MALASNVFMHNDTIQWRNAVWLLLSLAIFIVDQYTKNLIVAHFDYREVLPIFTSGGEWGFNLTLAHNYGAAFSFLADQSGWQRWFFAALALVVGTGLSVWLLRLPQGKPLLAAALALLVGGAFGNLYDRVLNGYVVDFLDAFYGAYHWPAFNVADSAICVGAALLLLESFFENKENPVEQGNKL
jgi:signal peptidase II